MDNAVLIAIIVAVAGIITSLISGLTLMQSAKTHQLINSRMDELIASTRSVAHAEGKAEGEQTQRDRESIPK